MHITINNIHGTEEQAVFICRVPGGEVVEVEDAYPEHCVVGTDTEIGHHHNRENLRRGKVQYSVTNCDPFPALQIVM